MKEESEAFICENEERMARHKAYIHSLGKDIGRCEVKGSGRWCWGRCGGKCHPTSICHN